MPGTAIKGYYKSSICKAGDIGKAKYWRAIGKALKIYQSKVVSGLSKKSCLVSVIHNLIWEKTILLELEAQIKPQSSSFCHKVIVNFIGMKWVTIANQLTVVMFLCKTVETQNWFFYKPNVKKWEMFDSTIWY